MTPNRCACGTPTRDNLHVCDTCIGKLADDLGDIPALSAELLVTLSRQAALGPRIGGRSAETPLPIDWLASVTLGTMANTVQAWAAIVSGGDTGRGHPLGSVAILLSHLDWVQRDQLGPQLLDEVRYLVAEMRRRIDQPPVRFYAGPCQARTVVADISYGDDVISLTVDTDGICGQPLHVTPGAVLIVCSQCGARYAAAARRDWLLGEVEDALLPLRPVWDALPSLIGIQPTWDVVRRWPERKGPRRLEVRGVNTVGVELFRGGDVLHLVRTDNRRRVRAGVT